MSEAPTPPPVTPQPPPSEPPHSPPPVSPPGGGGESGNRTIMLILAYLGPLALIPLLTEKQDSELQWHAKHGLVLFGVAVILSIVSTVVSSVIPILGCFAALGILMLTLILFLLDLVCMVKAIGGERFLIPGLSPLVDKL